MSSTHRTLHSDDWPEVERLVRVWDPGSPDNEYWGAQIWRFTAAAQQSESAVPPLTVVTEDHSGAIVSFAAAYRVPCTGRPEEAILYMTPLVVAVEARHQGVATGLVRYLADRARYEIERGRIATAPILVWEGGEGYTWERYGCVPAGRLGIAPPRPDLPSKFWHGIDLAHSSDARDYRLGGPNPANGTDDRRDEKSTATRVHIAFPELFSLLDERPPDTFCAPSRDPVTDFPGGAVGS